MNKRDTVYIHKNLFEPKAPDHLEKLAESLLNNFHREHILQKVSSKNLTAVFLLVSVAQ